MFWKILAVISSIIASLLGLKQSGALDESKPVDKPVIQGSQIPASAVSFHRVQHRL